MMKRTRVHWNMRITMNLGRQRINSIRDRAKTSYLFVTNSVVRLGLDGCAMRRAV